MSLESLSSKGRPATVDRKRDPGDERRFIRSQENGRPGDLSRLAGAGEHCLGNLSLMHLASLGRGYARANRPRANRIRADSLRTEIERRTASETHQPVLQAGVDRG